MILIPPEDLTRLKNASKVAQAVENKFALRVEEAINESSNLLSHPDTVVYAPDFEAIYAELYFEAYIRSFKQSEKEPKGFRKLALPKMSLKKVMDLYDLWRKGLFKPRAATKYGREMKKTYIAAVQRAWTKHSADFRNGGEETKEDIRDAVKKEARTTTARAQTIVRTENTRFFNKARVDYYNHSEDITHYLFMAVRDKATTPWCTPSLTNGKRGRHGLVYTKGTKVFEDERAPCHWNCRSEILPLNRHNPSHRRIIENESIRRENVTCYPLPRGWSK